MNATPQRHATAEAIKTVHCLASYLRGPLHRVASRSHRLSQHRILEHCRAVYDADVAALADKQASKLST
jgi:hypothetical protein